MSKRAEDVNAFATHLCAVVPVPGPGEEAPKTWYIRVYQGLNMGTRQYLADREFRLDGIFGVTKAVDVIEWCQNITARIGQKQGTIWFEALTTGDMPSMVVWTRIYSEGDPDERRQMRRNGDEAPSMNEHGAAAVMAHELVQRSRTDAETIQSLQELNARMFSGMVDIAFVHGQNDIMSKIGGANASLAAKERAFNKLADLNWPAIIAAWKAPGPIPADAAGGGDAQPEGGNARVKWDLACMSKIGQDLVALRAKDKANFTPEDIDNFEKMISGASQMIAAIRAGAL